jgi:hypothetical protein
MAERERFVTVWRWIHGVMLLIVLAAAIFLLYELLLLVRGIRLEFGILSGNFNTLLVTANAAALNTRDASEQARLAAIEQRAYWNKTSLETYKTMASLRLTITRTDQSINDVLVLKLGAALDGTTELSTTAAANLAQTMEGLRPTLANLSRASAAAADALADPQINETLQHLDDTAAHAADAANQMAGVAADAHAETGLIVGQTREAFKPQNKLLSIAKMLAGGTVTVAELLYYLTH